MTNRKITRLDLAVILILILAAVLRSQFLMQPLTDWFTWREASTAMMADNLPRNGWSPLWPEVSWTGDQVGYQGREFQLLTIIAAVLDKLFGWHDWHGRLIAIACGVLSVLALYQIVLHLHCVAQARAAAFVFAVMPGAIVIDSSYLPDPAMLALVTTTFWTLIVGLKTNRLALLMLAGLLGMLALLAKLPALACLPAAAYLLWKASPSGGRIRYLLLCAAAVAAITVPVIGYYRWAVHLGTTYPPFHVAGHGWLWEDGFSSFLDRKFYIGAFRDHARDWLWTWPIIVLAAVGAFLPLRFGDRDERPSGPTVWPIFFHVWLAGCALFYIVAAKELTDNPWNLHIFNPAVAVMAGRGLLWVGTGGQSTYSFGAWVRMGAIALLTSYAGYSAAKVPKDDVATEDYLLGAHLAKLSAPSDLVIATGSDAGNPVAIYYSRRRGWIFPPPPYQPDYSIYLDDGSTAIDVFEQLRQRGARWFGFVKRARDFNEPRRRFVEHHTQLMAHVAAVGALVVDEPAYRIYSLRKPDGP